MSPVRVQLTTISWGAPLPGRFRALPWPRHPVPRTAVPLGGQDARVLRLGQLALLPPALCWPWRHRHRQQQLLMPAGTVLVVELGHFCGLAHNPEMLGQQMGSVEGTLGWGLLWPRSLSREGVGSAGQHGLLQPRVLGTGTQHLPPGRLRPPRHRPSPAHRLWPRGSSSRLHVARSGTLRRRGQGPQGRGGRSCSGSTEAALSCLAGSWSWVAVRWQHCHRQDPPWWPAGLAQPLLLLGQCMCFLAPDHSGRCLASRQKPTAGGFCSA